MPSLHRKRPSNPLSLKYTKPTNPTRSAAARLFKFFNSASFLRRLLPCLALIYFITLIWSGHQNSKKPNPYLYDISSRWDRYLAFSDSISDSSDVFNLLRNSLILRHLAASTDRAYRVPHLISEQKRWLPNTKLIDLQSLINPLWWHTLQNAEALTAPSFRKVCPRLTILQTDLPNTSAEWSAMTETIRTNTEKCLMIESNALTSDEAITLESFEGLLSHTLASIRWSRYIEIIVQKYFEALNINIAGPYLAVQLPSHRCGRLNLWTEHGLKVPRSCPALGDPASLIDKLLELQERQEVRTIFIFNSTYEQIDEIKPKLSSHFRTIIDANDLDVEAIFRKSKPPTKSANISPIKLQVMKELAVAEVASRATGGTLGDASTSITAAIAALKKARWLAEGDRYYTLETLMDFW